MTSETAFSAQYNLLTGELEPLPVLQEQEEVAESGWLFDPDFGLVLPEDVAGRQVIVDEGIALAFPVSYKGMRKPPQRFDGHAQHSIRHALELGLSNGTAAGQPEYRPSSNGDRQLYVSQADDAAQLVLSGFGMYLGKKSERLQVKLAGKALYEFPFFRISEVVVASRGVSLSSDLLKEFCERGIRLTFVEASGRPYAMLSSPVLTATVESRREQLTAYNDRRGLDFSRLIVRGKIRNQRHLLLYFGKYLKQSDPERFAAVAGIAHKLRALELQARKIDGTSIAERRSELMGVEGVAGRMYWEGVKAVIESKAEFAGRVHQGASDAFNSLLNYGYGILYAQVWGAVVNAGLEPFAGYMHVDRPGKPSLVLDMVEEFRQPIVDRTVIAFTNLGQTAVMDNGMLDESTRRTIAQKVLERLSTRESFRGKQYQIRSIIQMQARSLVSFLRGQGEYRPFSFRW